MIYKILDSTIKQCKNCKKEFHLLTANQKFCCVDCKNEYTKAIRRERYIKPLEKIHTCQQCGKPLEPYGSQKFCSDECRVQHRKESRNKSGRKCDRVKEPKVLKKCINCHSDIPWNRNYASTYYKKKFCSKTCSNNYFRLHKEDFKGSQRNKGEFKIIITKLKDKFIWEAKKDNKVVLKCDKPFNTYRECVKDSELAF